MSLRHTENLTQVKLSVIVGGRGASPPRSHFTRAWTGFRPSCLPNNLSGEESDQPRQRTRLTVPDCALPEIRCLTQWSYSISCLTEDGCAAKQRGAHSPPCVRLWACLSSRCRFDCKVKGGSRGHFGQLTLEPQQAVLVINLRLRSEVNAEHDLLSPVQLKTKRGCWEGRLNVTQVDARVSRSGSGLGVGRISGESVAAVCLIEPQMKWVISTTQQQVNGQGLSA